MRRKKRTKERVIRPPCIYHYISNCIQIKVRVQGRRAYGVRPLRFLPTNTLYNHALRCQRLLCSVVLYIALSVDCTTRPVDVLFLDGELLLFTDLTKFLGDGFVLSTCQDPKVLQLEESIEWCSTGICLDCFLTLRNTVI